MNNDQPPPHPLNDPNFHANRSLYLTDWETLVQPDQKAALDMVSHSVTYGSTALQAAYILNGGALAALPALLTSLTTAGAARIAVAAIPFVVGIVCAATSSLSAYFNFQLQAFLRQHDSVKTAAMLARFYQGNGVDPDPKTRTNFLRGINFTLAVGVIAAIASLGAFIWGSWAFIELAQEK